MVVLKVTNDKALCIVAAKKDGREKDPSNWPAEYEPDDGAARRGEVRKHHQTIFLSELNETWEYEYIEVVPENVYKFYDVYI
jgi:hypothetical protein